MAGCAVTAMMVGLTTGNGAVGCGAPAPVSGGLAAPPHARTARSKTIVAARNGKMLRGEKGNLFTRQQTAGARTRWGLEAATPLAESAGCVSRGARAEIPKPKVKWKSP